MNVTVTIIQPSVNRDGHVEPQRETTQELPMRRDQTRRQLCEEIFARFGNHPSPSYWFPWFRRVNNAGMYSLSIGAVIQFCDEAYVCANYGFVRLSLANAKAWLEWKGQRSYGDFISLEEWANEAGIDVS